MHEIILHMEKHYVVRHVYLEWRGVPGQPRRARPVLPKAR